ncbi:MAG: type II toxin-antitoxin system VapC family toxin [Arenimonas sp.]|nr:type II toxin-antitoxin system VapC family toxin [Arenimonas sp.]
MLYVDTSILVAALLNEAHTDPAQQWLAKQAAGQLVISDWVITEFSAALSVKLRNGDVEQEHRSEALALFTRLTEEAFDTLPASRADFRTAARFADQYQTGLRAGDALHLAIAANHGASLHTLDKRLAKAGQSLGVSTTLLA